MTGCRDGPRAAEDISKAPCAGVAVRRESIEALAEKAGRAEKSDRNAGIEPQVDKGQSPKRNRSSPKVCDVDLAKVQEALARIERQINAADLELLQGLVDTLAFVMSLLRAQRTTIARLRRLFKLTSSEKTAAVVGDKPEPGTAGQTAEPGAAGDGAACGGPCAPPAGRPPSPEPEKPKPTKAKGHGRVPASEYEAAQHFPVAHQSLTAGHLCPGCGCGKLYDTKEPAQLLRIVGQPLLAALCWDCQRLRCGACGKVYTAQAPKEAQGPKYDETAVSMLVLCRYGVGLPHHRLERLQRNLQTPVPAATQWDVLNENASLFQPVFEELERRAAQGKVVHDDDSYVRILEFMGKRRAELLNQGKLPDPERTGLFTTAIISVTEQGLIALFRSGRKYAGENLADLLDLREPTLEPPILMSDALCSRNLPKGHPVVEANCNAHGRRGIVEQIENFPAECIYVLQLLRKVFVTEAQCKAQGLSESERLRVHQRDSGPVMEQLHGWLTAQLADKRVEPNSGLGQAYRYLLKHWVKLTLFLRKEGAPLDNNICERALKMAIRHRRNSLFYRSQHGARIGDRFMSLIYTAELHGQNAFDYLTQVQRHAKDAKEHPGHWLPWTYRATLERLGGAQTSSRAPPPRRPPPPRPSGPPAAAPPPAL